MEDNINTNEKELLYHPKESSDGSLTYTNGKGIYIIYNFIPTISIFMLVFQIEQISLSRQH